MGSGTAIVSPRKLLTAAIEDEPGNIATRVPY